MKVKLFGHQLTVEIKKLTNMWIATITKMVDEGATKRVTFKFEKGDQVIEQTDGGFTTDEQIKRYAFNQIRAYSEKETIVTKENEVLDLSEFEPKPRVEPTEEQLAQVAYKQKRADLTMLKQDLDLGIVDKETYDSALSELKALK